MKFLLRFWLVFACLFILAFPFRMLKFINPASWLNISAGISDSRFSYLYILALIVIACIAALVWRPKSTQSKMWYWVHSGTAYYLSLILLVYGFSKIFKYQFYLPEPNILFTPTGMLDKDMLYWSAMGSSYTYSVFLGLCELLPAILLLIPRTRALGGALAFFVLLNVVAINFSFDITVKLRSMVLLLFSAVAALPLMFHSAILVRPVWTSQRQKLRYSLVKSFIICLMMFDSLYPYAKSGSFNDDQSPRPYLHGAYDVITFVKGHDTLPPLLTDTSRFRRIFIHRQGYFIIQKMNDRFEDYMLDMDRDKQKITFLKKRQNLQYQFSYRVLPDKKLFMQGNWGKDSISFIAELIDLNKLPLLRQQFHWFSD